MCGCSDRGWQSSLRTPRPTSTGCRRRYRLLSPEALPSPDSEGDSNRLSCLAQYAADDFQAAVRLLLQRVERVPGFALVVDDMDALGDLPAGRLRLAELETLVAIDRRVGVLDHRHEDIGMRKRLVDAGRGIGIGGGRVIATERLFLRSDHALRIGDVVRAGGKSEAEQ